MKTTLTFACLALVYFLNGVAAQDGAEKMPPDQQFVLKASAGGIAEVSFGNLAAEKSSHPSVKEFARKMVVDHSKANKELAALAEKKAMKPAMGMDEDHLKLRNKLAHLNGPEFDRAYVASQLKDHQDAVALFEKQVKEGMDDDLKKWASEILPHLREHLKMVEDIHKKMELDKR